MIVFIKDSLNVLLKSHVALHLAGFAHAVRHCQESYMGPIVVVIPPVVPDDPGGPGDTGE